MARIRKIAIGIKEFTGLEGLLFDILFLNDLLNCRSLHNHFLLLVYLTERLLQANYGFFLQEALVVRNVGRGRSGRAVKNFDIVAANCSLVPLVQTVFEMVN